MSAAMLMRPARTPYAPRQLRSDRHQAARAARDLADWLLWLELGRAAPATLDAYERTCADLLNQHPAKAFGDFDDGDLMRLLMTYPEKSRRIRKAHLASWFRWGYQQRKIPANPVDLLPRIRQPHPRVQDIFPAGDEAALRALPSPDGPLMALLFAAGLRKAEARMLTGRRIDFDRRLVIISEGAKGSRDRVVPMIPELEQALADLFFIEQIQDSDYLWYDKPGGAFAVRLRRTKPIAQSAFHRWWTRSLDVAGVKYRNPHMARHTFATRWRERGLDLDELRDLMGHASVQTTSDLYVHSQASRLADRMRALIGAEA